MNKKIQKFFLKKYYRKIKLHFDKEIDRIKVECQEMRKTDVLANIAISTKEIDNLKKIHAKQLEQVKENERAKWEAKDEKKQAEIDRLTEIIQDNKEKYEAIKTYEIDLQDMANEIIDKMDRATKKESEVISLIKGVGATIHRYGQIQTKKDSIRIKEDV